MSVSAEINQPISASMPPTKLLHSQPLRTINGKSTLADTGTQGPSGRASFFVLDSMIKIFI
jgi:hypothetical protein